MMLSQQHCHGVWEPAVPLPVQAGLVPSSHFRTSGYCLKPKLDCVHGFGERESQPRYVSSDSVERTIRSQVQINRSFQQGQTGYTTGNGDAQFPS
jgi:hypothetical protein